MNQTLASSPLPQRSLHGADKALQGLGVAACAALTLFVVGTQLLGRFPNPVQYGTALMLAIVAISTLRPRRHDGTRSVLSLVVGALAALAAVATWAYYSSEYQEIASFREGLPNQWDLVCFGVGTVLVILAGHRAEGWFLTSVVLGAVAYLAFGHLMPGILAHRPYSLERILEVSYGYRGIFGVALGAVVDIVIVFVVLGTALRLTGAGEFFNDMSLLLTRGKRSGPAQAAIVASSFFGSINGSAPANVAATGVLTIPMMKKAGFSPRFAGAVESTASCVGQIMPPVMGVGAFIMSDVTGIPYVTIMLAAVLPAMMYIISLSVVVALEAGRLGLEVVEDAAKPAWTRSMTVRAGLLVLTFGSLLTMLLSGLPATFSGLVATGLLLAAAMGFPETRLSWRNGWALLVDSGRDSLSVLLACAAIGIVIAAISSTGLGIKLNQEITILGKDSLLLGLVLAALCSVVLGMGLPTAASYLMVVFVAGPAIIELGVPKLTAHLFVFYYAVLSAITPPVALAVFAAAAIAQTHPLGLALSAVRLAAVGFVLPLLWVYHPELMLTPDTDWAKTVQFVPLVLLAIVGFSAAHVGYLFRDLRPWERLSLGGGALLIIWPVTITNWIGGALLAAAALYCYNGRRRGQVA